MMDWDVAEEEDPDLDAADTLLSIPAVRVNIRLGIIEAIRRS